MPSPGQVVRASRTRGSRGWPLVFYMGLFVVALVVVAGGAALYVRLQSEQDARQAAQDDAGFAAGAASTDIATAVTNLESATSKLAANPDVARALAGSGPVGACTLSFAGGSVFSSGHIDIVRSDGTVICSSHAVPAGPVYGHAVWLPAAINGPVIAPLVFDPATAQTTAVISSPVSGLGAVVAFVDLTPLGPDVAARFGGIRHLEFMVATSDGKTILARSDAPSRWVGTALAGTTFARSTNAPERQDLDGTWRLYGSSSVAGTGWKVYAGADENSALAAAQLIANRDLAIILAGVGIMLVLTFVVYRRVTEPVRRLSLRVRRAAQRHDADDEVGEGAAEVGDLAEDFDRLIDTVKNELAERLRSEHSARVSERSYRRLFEGHPQPMWLYDTGTFAFLEVNDAAVEHYGYSRAEFLSMTVKDVRPPQDLPKFLELNGGDLPALNRSGPWRHLLKDGSVIQVLVTSHAVAFGDHSARLVMAEDLTETQRLEIELHQSQARVENNAALSRAKDEMVAMVSHELRTPLASLVGFTELLVTRDVTEEQRKDYLRVMLQEGHRLTALINNFLDLRRMEGGHHAMRFAPADYGALIERAIEIGEDGSRVPVETRLPSELPLVLVDSDSILRVLTNLVANARKYSPHGGQIEVGAVVSGNTVEVYVKDHGLGIPREALPHLFSRFYRVETVDRRGISGTGLGLAICKKIVEAHGGKIGARSEGAGQGSVFYFTVPIAREASRSGEILLVEDDAGFAQLLQAELAGRGFTSAWAADAETAEQLLTQAGTRAVVLDLLLPGLQGEDFLKRLRAIHRLNIPVVVVTFKDIEPAESAALQKLGVTAVLRKGPGSAQTAGSLVAQAVVQQRVAS